MTSRNSDISGVTQHWGRHNLPFDSKKSLAQTIVVQHIDSKRLRRLAITTSERNLKLCRIQLHKVSVAKASRHFPQTPPADERPA